MNVKEQIKRHEGLELKPYLCTSGKATIGYGRNIEDRGITEDEADYMLDNDIKFYRERLKAELDFFDDLNDGRKSVVINMAFNLGMRGLLGFKDTLKHIKDGDYDLASIEMMNSRWAKQVPRRAGELAEQMKEGKFIK